MPKEKIKLSTGLKNSIFLLKYLIKYLPLFFWSSMLQGVLWGIVNVTGGVVALKIVFDKIQSGAPFSEIARFIVLLCIGFLFIFAIISLFSEFSRAYFQHKLKKYIHTELFKKAMDIDMCRYDDPKFYTDFIWAVKEAENRIYSVLQNLQQTITYLLTGGGTIAVLLLIDPLVLAVILFSLSATFVFKIISAKISYKRETELMPINKKTDYIARVFYLADYAKELRMTPVSNLLISDFDSSISQMHGIYKKTQRKLGLLAMLEALCTSFMLNAGVIFLFIYKLNVQNSITTGDFAVSLNATFTVYWVCENIMKQISKFIQNGLYAEKLKTFLNTKTHILSPKLPKELSKLPCMFEIKNLSFSYEGLEGFALKNINMKIGAGEKIAIVGYNGAGKTTLIKLIMRLYDPNKGEILFNDKNIREYNVEEYRHSFGTLFQDFQIYGATLGENVKTDRVQEKDEQNILNALKTAGLDRAIMDINTQLTREYDKEGRNVSGGEAQKIALSRVFMKNPHTYILDEPSSALDPISEYNFNKRIVEASEGKTVIFISHRLSTTRMADRIYVLENGEIIESGSHNELIAQDGKYAHMFKIQAEKYARSACD